jgi:hypothetical protein
MDIRPKDNSRNQEFRKEEDDEEEVSELVPFGRKKLSPDSSIRAEERNGESIYFHKSSSKQRVSFSFWFSPNQNSHSI